MSDRKLTPKQERFCQLYTTHWVATRAAIEAGYSEKNASSLGYQLLQIPTVKARIEELKEHALKEIGVSRERVLLECARIAFFDPKKALDDQGQPKLIQDMDEDTRRCVSEVEIRELFDGSGDARHVFGQVKNVKFVSKKVGLDILKVAAGLNTERHELTGPDGKAIEINHSKLSDAELDARIQKLLGSQATDPDPDPEPSSGDDLS